MHPEMISSPISLSQPNVFYLETCEKCFLKARDITILTGFSIEFLQTNKPLVKRVRWHRCFLSIVCVTRKRYHCSHRRQERVLN